ncbi:MAG: SDR family oxidoreductase [Sphingomonadales bacterium]|nr:SDR family oxidoreductase [Sphingomonadales bacterium]
MQRPLTNSLSAVISCRQQFQSEGKAKGRFEGKVAIVTGGARGIGAATAARLAADGAQVLVLDQIDPESLPKGAEFLRADLTDGSAAAGAVAEAVRRFGRLDFLVNNAGMGAFGETPDMAEDLWDKVFAINVRAIFLLCKAAIPAMRDSGGGAIVNIASISGMLGDYAMDAYNASKGAVINYTRTLALNGARDGIRVNAVCPGLVETAMSGPAVADADDRAFWFDRIPMQRWARPEELAGVIAFLLSDDASYMTGAIVPVDGGVTAHTGQPNSPERRRLRALRNG